MQLSKNLGHLDRKLRFITGIILIGLALTGTIGVWGWVGAILIGTAFINFCPIYRVVGFKTCSDC